MMEFPYATPRCDYDRFIEATALLTGSDLTDDSAGEFLIDGGQFEF